MIAVNTLREQPHYRRAAFTEGCETLGYKMSVVGQPKDDRDLLIVWNLHGGNEQRANEWEAKGGTVVVVENGYLAPREQQYAISVHGHNGSGRYQVGTDDRFAAVGVELQPWRTEGYILVAGQRGIGSRLMASPPQWEDNMVKRLRELKHRDVVLRRHPGTKPPKTDLAADLAGAGLCIIWSSAVGVHALAAGVPVIFCAPHWICEGAATRGLGSMGDPCRSDGLRAIAMHRMAYGQWTVPEIASGEPFARILSSLKSRVTA